MRHCLVAVALIAAMAPACGTSSSTSGASRSPSPAATPSPYFDTAPRELTTGFAPGIGGQIACSTTDLVFSSGVGHDLYTTSLTAFNARKLVTVAGKIGPVGMSGKWVSFAEYAQDGQALTPLAAWTVYGVEISSGRVVRLASGNDATQLSELPYPTVGDGFIVWDQLMTAGHKVLWRYDESSGATMQLNLPTDMYPVHPSASGTKLLFLDNNRDPHHAQEVWLDRGGEPLYYDVGGGSITHLAPGLVVYDDVLTDTRAVWLRPVGTGYAIEDVVIPGGAVHKIAETTVASPVRASGDITIWQTYPRGAVTAHLGSRTAIVSPDLAISPGGVALCAPYFYYGGRNLSLQVAKIA